MNKELERINDELNDISENFGLDGLDKVLSNDILQFFLVIAKADKKLKDDEVDYINNTLGTYYSKSTLEGIMKTSNLKEKTINNFTCHAVNELLKVIYDNENYTRRISNLITDISSLYNKVGLDFLSCDEKVDSKELKAYSKYSGMINKIANDTFNDLKRYRLPEDRAIEDEDENMEDLEDLDTLINNLNEMVGLDNVKEEILSTVNLIKVRKMREERGYSNMPMSYHMVFTGNPGTGKTTIARLLSKIYNRLGVLSKGQLIETDRSGLVAGYIGQTAIKTKEMCEKAYGGILFIDEAYTLTYKKGESDYGFEAVDTILKEMEDHRDDLIIIAAGYPIPMESFINSNPGLKSRFNKFIDFKDYTISELVDIFEKITYSNNYKLSDKAIDKIKEIIDSMSDEAKARFGNARGIRNMFEKAVIKQANRIVNEKNLLEDELLTIIDLDIE